MKVSHYYGKTPSSKANAVKISSNGIDIYYSYETIIAINVKGKLTIAKNKRGTTTGKHLNAITQNKSIRVEHSEILKIIKNLKITLD
jgi:hypothetical protein